MATPLIGSQNTRTDAKEYRHLGRASSVQLNEITAVTLVLRERANGDDLTTAREDLGQQVINQRDYLGQAQLAATHGYDPSDADSVRAWATRRGFDVIDDQAATGRIQIRGRRQDLADAFGVRMQRHELNRQGWPKTEYLDHFGPVSLDAGLAGRVTAVQGLCTIPVATSKCVILPAAEAASSVSYTPEQVAQIYGFMKLANGGAGLTFNIGIAELGGKVNQADLATVQGEVGNFTLTEESVDGAPIVSDPSGADGEVALDWQVIARVIKYLAPEANLNIFVKYAPNTNKGFSDLEASFASDGRDYSSVSTSWGGPIEGYAATDIAAMHAALQAQLVTGATPTIAAGDSGSTDGVTDGKQHVDYPSADDASLSCGGSKLLGDPTTATITSEVVWNELTEQMGAGGGGVNPGPVPTYQSANGVHPVSSTGAAGRGVPDIAMNADPTTGYSILVNGVKQVIGGTSAVAPLAAAFFALAGGMAGTRLGEVHPALYALAAKGTGINDITKGNNGAYTAGPGWDAASGVGSMLGALAPALPSAVPTPSAPTPGAPSAAQQQNRGVGLN